MSVADYDFYKNTFKGADIAPYDFDRLVLRANAYLDSIAICVLPDNDIVTMAQCAVAEQWRKNEQGSRFQRAINRRIRGCMMRRRSILAI